MTSPDYLAHLDAESERFGDLLADADLMQPVPSCPDWTAGDLFWHLTQVQWFWGSVVRERVADPDEVDATPPERPADLDSLCHLFATVSTGLHEALSDAAEDTPVWTWSADKTVGFVRRRQAHEALIHRLDAELATGRGPDQWAPIDPALASDGVDEALRIMHGIPEWGSWSPDGSTARIESTDTGMSWTVGLGRFEGTDPDDGTHDDVGAFTVLDVEGPDADQDPDATVRGTAADLDCWLWGRPRSSEEAIERTGDADVLRRVQEVLDQGID
jgi:uncharacterized protein (TIGR03083 family)